MSALIWVVMTLLCAISLAKDCRYGFQVRSCSGDQKIADELEYEINSETLNFTLKIELRRIQK